MKNIKLTLEVDGNKLTRNYGEKAEDWGFIVKDMLETIEKSNEPMK